MRKAATLTLVSWIFIFRTGAAWATQTHGGQEGLYSHQIAHGIFLAAMIYLCVRLIRSGDCSRRGWRWIFVSAFFFSLWNLDVLFVHAYTEFLIPDHLSGSLAGLPRSFHAASLPDMLYYLGRFDHLLSLPALIFFFAGIRTFLKEQRVCP